MERPLYLEDLSVGDRFSAGPMTVDADDIKRFAREYDPQPFHLDEEAAKSSMFRGLVASGWHTAALTMRLLTSGGMPLAGGLVGAGGELEWLRPVRPGDRLSVESEIIEITRSRSRKDRGTVMTRTRTLNQNSEVVQILTAKLVVSARPAAGGSRA
jgi:acyl dehydratase